MNDVVNDTRYAEIALNQGGVRQIYHYEIPATIGAITIGHLVEVGFGTAHVAGIVVGLSDTSPVPQTKPILARLDPDPVLTPQQIALARWLSEMTLAPFGACLWLMLPAGITRSGDKLYTLVETLTPDPSIDLTPQPPLRPHGEGESVAGRVIELLRERGALRGGQIDHALRDHDWKRAIAPLIKAGTIRREPLLVPPGVTAKQERTVTLAIPPDQVEAIVATLRKGSGKARTLRFLATQSEPLSAADVIAGAEANNAILKQLADKGWITFGAADSWRDPLAGRQFVAADPPLLTPDQAAAWEPIRLAVESRAPGVFLLHGVTGSGKTEIYLRAIEATIAGGRDAIALVPEIALVPQTVRRFMARFHERVALVHSGLTAGQQFDTWRRARAGAIDLVIGARSALFTPLPDIGLIILDEEHDSSYKQSPSPPLNLPNYHARETAIKMAELYGATVILGSATPDLVTAWRAERGSIHYLHLPDRVIVHRARLAEEATALHIPVDRYLPADAPDALAAPLPPVEVVDMRAELRAGNRSMFSRSLRTALNETLARGEQAMLYLNRRGTATIVLCRDCGYIARCPRCDSPLTYHDNAAELICHGCNYRGAPPATCPECGGTRIRYFGAGTALLEQVVRDEFPAAKVLRWDRDTTREHGAHDAILTAFAAGEANLLIGTQMIAKGLDIPRVTLVGVVSADTALGLPDYRAGERAFQLLTQVAGRAGRGWLGGRVVLQTYQPDHYAVRAAAAHDYAGFYARELQYRRELQYPPFKRLARVLFRDASPAKVQRAAEAAAAKLHEVILRERLTATQLVGPAPAFFAKSNDIYRWQLLVKSADPTPLLRNLIPAPGMFIDIDPIDVL